MDKIKIIMFGLTVTLCIMSGFLYVSLNSVKNSNSTLTAEKESIQKELDSIHSEKNTDVLIEQGDAKKEVNTFVQNFFNYNNDTFQNRYKEVKDQFSEEGYTQLTQEGVNSPPASVKIESKVTDAQIYLAANENDIISVLVMLKSNYSVNDSPIPMQQVVSLKLEKTDRKYKIIEYSNTSLLQESGY